MSSGGGKTGDLLDCLRNAKDQAQRRMCEQDFLDTGGRVERGKVFVDGGGNAVAVTDSGKVYDCRFLFDLK